MTTIGTWWMWVCFFVFILIMLAADLFLFGGRKSHRVTTANALSWTLVWFISAMVFALLLWAYLSHEASSVIANQRVFEFITGYLVEKSLSVDNIFVILMIFSYFAIPHEYQHRVLFYGILGALVMRLVMILLGIWAVERFHWILYLFGLFLLITGIKMFFAEEENPELGKNPLLRWMRKYLPITNELHGERFFVVQKRTLYLTPLFLALVIVETTDLIFAVDSIPAIFAVTEDPFIVFTSNIFAILGLRSLYFVLDNIHERFHLLKYGLAFILAFIGTKMLISPWFVIPITLVLGIVIFTLAACVLLSVYRPKH